MAFGLYNPILASDFINLKARVKAECARRQFNGSVASYASSSYDYTIQPTDGGIPLPEHLNKIIIPLNAINDSGFNQTQKGYLVRNIESAQQLLTTLESIDVRASNSGCKSSCTGLCQGTCTGSCENGCTGTCSNGCTGCGGECSTSCLNTCDGYCTDTCYGTCISSCTGSCYEGCYSGCKSGCQGSCKGNVSSNPT